MNENRVHVRFKQYSPTLLYYKEAIYTTIDELDIFFVYVDNYFADQAGVLIVDLSETKLPEKDVRNHLRTEFPKHAENIKELCLILSISKYLATFAQFIFKRSPFHITHVSSTEEAIERYKGELE